MIYYGYAVRVSPGNLLSRVCAVQMLYHWIALALEYKLVSIIVRARERPCSTVAHHRSLVLLAFL